MAVTLLWILGVRGGSKTKNHPDKALTVQWAIYIYIYHGGNSDCDCEKQCPQVTLSRYLHDNCVAP